MSRTAPTPSPSLRQRAPKRSRRRRTRRYQSVAFTILCLWSRSPAVGIRVGRERTPHRRSSRLGPVIKWADLRAGCPRRASTCTSARLGLRVPLAHPEVAATQPVTLIDLSCGLAGRKAPGFGFDPLLHLLRRVKGGKHDMPAIPHGRVEAVTESDPPVTGGVVGIEARHSSTLAQQPKSGDES